MDPTLIPDIAQFSTAGLIAWMWMTERRASAHRERQLGEAHERLMEQRVQLDALLQLVADNARAVASLEATQRMLLGRRAARSSGAGRAA